MTSIKNQISAFIYKNMALSKRRKASQTGLLVIFQILFVLAAGVARWGINEIRTNPVIQQIKDVKDKAAGDLSRANDMEKYDTRGNRLVSQNADFIEMRIKSTNASYPKPYVRQYLHDALFLVIGEEESSNNKVKVIADNLRAVLNRSHRLAIEIKAKNNNEDFKSGDMFDNYYLASQKSRLSQQDVGAHSLAGVFIVRQSPDSPDSIDVILNVKKELGDYVKESMLYYLLEAQRYDPSAPTAALSTLSFSDKRLSGDSTAGYRYVFGMAAAMCIIIPFLLFVLLTLSEKEDRILMLMQLNGITINGFLVSQLIYYFLMTLAPLALAIACIVINPDLVILSPPFFFMIYFLVVLMIQVPLAAICYSFLFKRKIFAISFAIFWVLGAPGGAFFLHHFTNFSFILWIPIYGIIIGTTYMSGLSGRTFTETIRLSVCWMPLAQSLISTILLYLLTIYLYNVVEQGYSGTLKKWHYPVTDLFYYFSGTSKGPGKVKKSKLLESVETVEMDSDVKAMMEMCDADMEKVARENLLVYSHINKIYPSGNQAVDNVTFALKGNRIFGLLGPNGAGKTTLMHITAGLYEASSGRVILNGIDSVLNRRAFHAMIGFCPQHDIYWKELSVQEHLQFFFILRGTNPLDIGKKIADLMHSVRLTQYANTSASKLSGGERRRLSLAMALSGDSKVVLLDEPTTGLDPKVRRIVSDIITEFRGNRLLLLTTHSMEEAELLSDELTIMAHGRLKCFGNVAHLKKKFGGQIFVSFENSHGRFQDAVQGIKDSCPPDTEASLVHEGLEGLSGRLHFSGDKKQTLVLMRNILGKKSEFGINTFGIVQSSLDDVFMNIVRAQDADA